MKKLLILAISLLALTVHSAPSVHAQNLNQFTIQDYQIDYYLDKDAEGRSTLKTVELITANFTQYNTNRGIERAIPTSYDGHSTNLAIESVTNEAGRAHNYTTYDSNGNTVLRIGNAAQYVNGIETYKITYTQRDVTKFYKDTNRDEFYWDTNGTEWRVPIQNLKARLHLALGVQQDLIDGKQNCYQGKAGSNTDCTITPDGTGLGFSFAVGATNLQPYENLTMAVGFKAQTFAPYKASLLEILIGLWILFLVFSSVIGFALIAWLSIRYSRKSFRKKELKTTVPEYIPPKNASVSVSASIFSKPSAAFSAQIIDLAVRHYLKIYQLQEKSLFKQANYELEIIKSPTDLRAEEKEVLKDIFGSLNVGAKIDMKTLRSNSRLSTNLLDNKKKIDKDIEGAYALRAKVPAESAWFKRAGFIILFFSIITLSPILLIAAIISFVSASQLKPLTDEGLALYRYLKGLEMYIKVAETERLRMLQSPEGAARLDAPVDTGDTRQLIKLYERVLPYAILFGQEKDWNKQLGNFYESTGQSPTWYSSNTAFNAAVFSSAIGNFSSMASYSDPSSSSSGGSGGGGSSGGGGGGGGGGGW